MHQLDVVHDVALNSLPVEMVGLYGNSTRLHVLPLCSCVIASGRFSEFPNVPAVMQVVAAVHEAPRRTPFFGPGFRFTPLSTDQLVPL
jgi:hypothetical protein